MGRRQAKAAACFRPETVSRLSGFPVMSDWHLYLIRTRYGALYAGIATDLGRRISEHEGAGRKGSKYLRSKGPLELAYKANIGSRGLALKAEKRIRKLPKRRKEELVAANPGRAELLKALAIEDN
jgi:putative endonuclease